MTPAYYPPSFTAQLNAARPDIIYHYTNQLGLLGIIEKRELWATKIHYLNDATEFSLVFKMIEGILERERDDAHALSERKALAELLHVFTKARETLNICGWLVGWRPRPNFGSRAPLGDGLGL
jgi:hypothetical protein